MITSSSNAQVKQMIQLNKKARERRKQDVFIVEGLRMFREVPRDRLVKTYVSENFLEDPEHEALLQGIPYEVVKDSVFAQMSDTLTPQGVLTVVRQYHYTMVELRWQIFFLERYHQAESFRLHFIKIQQSCLSLPIIP